MALAVAAGRDRHLAGVAFRRRLDVLLPVVDHLHGPAAFLREQERVKREKRGVLLLPAESAARDGLCHVHVRVVQAEGALDTLVDVERALQRAHEVGPAPVPEGEHPLRLDVELLLVMGAIGSGETNGALGDGLRRVALRDPVGGEDVVGAVNLRLALERVGDGQDRRERVDLGREGAKRAGEAHGILGRHERDRLVRVADLVRCEDGLVLLDERHDVHGHVFGRHDRHTGPVERRIPSDAAQPAARHGAAERRAQEDAWPREIVDVAGRPGDLGRSIHARNALAHERHAVSLP
jgi:hypothetical protein